MSILDSISNEVLEKLVQDSTSLKELARKLGYAGNGYNGDAIKRRCKDSGISLDHFTGLPQGQTKRSVENVFIEHSTASQATLRRWYAKGNYTEYKCSICGQAPYWNGQELTLTLDHINGINNDDRIENLRWVCPNCDRQLETFCSKNIKKQSYVINYCIDCGKEISSGAIRCPECSAKQQQKVARPTPEQLELDIKALGFCGTGRKYGVSDNSIRKWCQKYGMPTIAKAYR